MRSEVLANQSSHGVFSITMSSLELVDFINEDRRERAHAQGVSFPSYGFARLEHADFLKKVPQVLGQELAGKFSCKFVVATGNGGERTSPGYRFPKREACLMAMSYSYELQAKVFDRMTALEQSGQNRAPTIDSHEGALLALQQMTTHQLALIQENKRTAAELALAAPKVAFVDRYVAATSGEKGFREVCKLLGANELEFSEFLARAKIMYRLAGKMTPHAEHLAAGRFKVKTGTAPRNEHAYAQAKFTPKGVEWIAGLWGKHKAALALESGVQA